VKCCASAVYSSEASGSLAPLPRYATAALLALIAALGFGWRAHHAASPYLALQSRDELAYVTLGQRLATRGIYEGGEDWPLRWPPGAPAFFAVAYKLDHSAANPAPKPDIPSAYWLQALAGAATILVAFGIAALAAGPIAGLLAAAATAFYPPLVTMTADLLSEPAGTLALGVGVLAAVWALRGRSARRYALAGVLLGVATLVRADFVFLPVLLALYLAIGLRRRGPALALLACSVLVVAPWSVYISARAGHATLVTTGDAPVLFIGTCLPCDGTLIGLKQSFGDETRRHDPSLRDVPDSKLPASAVLGAVAARQPHKGRESALRGEAMSNIGHDVAHPIAYAGMELRKLRQLWLRPSHIGTSRTLPVVAALHLALVLAALAGLIAGLIRARSAALTAIALPVAYGTAVHLVTTADSRYNLPLVPLLFAGGAAGLFGARSRAGRTPCVSENTASAAVSTRCRSAS
jgi:hypothetical protein